MKYNRFLLLLFCLITVPVLVYGGATVNVKSVSTIPGGTATIDVTVSAVPAPGVTDIQGRFTFNPNVVHITDIVGLEGFAGFFFKVVDNVAGTAVVTAAIVGVNGLTDGGILRLTVQAVGAAGDSCVIGLTMNVLRHADGTNIPHTVTPGTFTVAAVGNLLPTANFTFTPAAPAINDPVTFTDASADPDGTIVAWSWTFGDGGISLIQNPTHQYANGGNFTVTLTVTDDGGATASTSQTVTVLGPSAAFTFTPISPTTQDPVRFFDQSTDLTADIVSWSWVFGDGGVSSDQNPTHTFATPGTYRVNLTITNAVGATVSTYGDITVRNAPPIAAFTFAPPQPKVGEMVTFSAGGSSDPDGHIILYEWDFNSDGIFEIAGGGASTVTHAFGVNGQQRVTLRVTDDAGGRDLITRPVPVGIHIPTAAFTFTPTDPKINVAVTFDAGASTDPDGTIISYLWTITFAGAPVATYTGRSFNTVFDTLGNYRVQLTVTDNDGLQDSDVQWVVVTTTPPVANFTFAPATPRIGEAVKFNAVDSTDPDGRIISYEWDFPDVPGAVNATGIEVSHSFTQAGTQRVTLTVTDNDGNRRSITRVVPVETTPPVAAFTFEPEAPDAGQEITFDGRGSADADGRIILWEWDFHEDRTTDLTGSVVTYSFPMPGAYPVRLTVTDDDGAISVITLVVPVEVAGVGPVNQLPKADFTFKPAEIPDVSMNEVVTFKAVGSTDADGTIVAYEWDFDNDGVYDATGKTAPHVFHSGGSQIVTLRVTDNAGGRGFKTSVVSVDFVRPIADFTTTPDEPVIGAVVTFYGGASSDADGHIDFYAWDFDGDGVVDATGMSVNHAFTTGGSHPVTLTVTDNDGVPDSTTRTVFVRINILPTAGFTYLPESPTIADTITFTDTSADADGTIVAWQWDFGDGTTRTVQNPTHTYAAAGTYIVRLTVTDNDGASSSVTENVIVAALVNVPPVANFRFAPTLPQVDRAVQFTSLGTDVDGTVTGWEWDFGDGATSTVRNPAHTYTSVGTYTVTLIVIDDNGARSAAVTRQITIAQAGEYIVTFSYPNPASTHARIVYFHPAGTTDLVLRIFNLVGWLVYQTDLTVGASPYIWDLMSNDGEDLPNGLYFFQITARDDDGRTIRSQVFRLLIQR